MNTRKSSGNLSVVALVLLFAMGASFPARSTQAKKMTTPQPVMTSAASVRLSQDGRDTIIEQGDASLRVTSVNSNSFTFEVKELGAESNIDAVGSLRYSDSAIDFALQDQDGKEVRLKAKNRGQGNFSIKLSAGGSSVSLRFDGEKALELARRTKQLQEEGRNRELARLAPEILTTITPFEEYRAFIRQEVSSSPGLGVLADLLARQEGESSNVAVSSLGNICAFLAPSIRFTTRATKPRIVKASYAPQIDQMCLIGCVAFFSGNVGTCSAIWTVGDAMWWACLAVDAALTAWCMSQCGGMAN